MNEREHNADSGRLSGGQSDPAGSDGYVPGEWDEIRDAYLDGHLSAEVYDKLRRLVGPKWNEGDA